LDKIESRLASAPPAPAAAPESAKPSVVGAKSTADSLLELKKLLDAGAITQAEYDAKKKVILEKL